MEWTLSELGNVADMIQSLSATERGLTAQQGAQLAQRVRAAVNNLRNSEKSHHHHSLGGGGGGGAGLAARRSVDGGSPVAMGLDLVNAATPSAAAASKGGELPSISNRSSPRRPVPPTSVTAGAAGGATTPRREEQPFKISKPSSVRVALVARESAPPTSALVMKEVARQISTSLYNVLESMTLLVEGQSSHVYVRRGEEMISIVNVGQKLRFPPNIVRHGSQGSLAAGVLATSIAVNQRVLTPGRPPTSTLCFPVRPSIGSSSPPSAVVEVHNKRGGAASFSEVDENVVNICAAVIGDMLAKFSSLDWLNAFYDPITQHMVTPFEPKGQGVPLKVQDADGGTVFLTAADATKRPLLETLESFVQPQLVRRVTLPLTALNSAAPVGLGAAPSLKEVDTYLENLNDCWRRSVDLNVTQTQSERQRVKDIKGIREDLQRHKARNAALEEVIRMHTLDSSDYQREYSTLKTELETFLASKGRLD